MALPSGTNLGFSDRYNGNLFYDPSTKQYTVSQQGSWGDSNTPLTVDAHGRSIADSWIGNEAMLPFLQKAQALNAAPAVQAPVAPVAPVAPAPTQSQVTANAIAANVPALEPSPTLSPPTAVASPVLGPTATPPANLRPTLGSPFQQMMQYALRNNLSGKVNPLGQSSTPSAYGYAPGAGAKGGARSGTQVNPQARAWMPQPRGVPNGQ